MICLNPLSAKFIKWSNTLKQIVGKLPTICLSVFDHFSGLAFKGLMMHWHFRMKFDANLSMEEFHRKISAPFVKTLLEEILAAFHMSSIDPTESLCMLDPGDIPKENLAEYDNKKLEILFDFYVKPPQYSYEGPTVVSPALINCTQESLALEYKHYKECVLSRRNDLTVELLPQEKSIKRKIYWLKVDATKNKKEYQNC